MPARKLPSKSHAKHVIPARGEIWYADLEPTRGDEINKQRPVLVLGTKAIGLDLSIVVPLTTWRADFASVWHIIEVQKSAQSGLSVQSGASCYHVRSLSNARCIRKIGNVTAVELDEITACVQNCVEL
jgi:mRNA interferase MazF